MRWRDELTRLFPALVSLPPGSYVVGGAVRDLLLGRTPADVDVAAIDPMDCARALGRKVITLGTQEHLRAYRVVDGEHVYDFAELLDHDVDADLARRDFTVNAMAVDLEKDALLDPHGGEQDIATRTVRMVDPTNFDDDPLRTLKGVRMAVKYGFTIEPATLEAIRARAARIADVAVERVTYELSVIFSSGKFDEAVELLHETGLDVPLGLACHPERSEGPGRVVRAAAPPDPQVPRYARDDIALIAALAVLVADPRPYGERWRWSETLIREVLGVQRLLAEVGDLRMALYDAGETVARAYIAAMRALGRDESIELPDFSIRPLLTGEEIAEATGLPPGKELGAIKRALLEAQVRGEVSTRDEALAFATASA